MMRDEFGKFLRNGKLWGDLGSVRRQQKLVGTTIIRNLNIQNCKKNKKRKREARK
jgi:hypothetical protein